jgi:hypothetical protein
MDAGKTPNISSYMDVAFNTSVDICGCTGCTGCSGSNPLITPLNTKGVYSGWCIDIWDPLNIQLAMNQAYYVTDCFNQQLISFGDPGAAAALQAAYNQMIQPGPTGCGCRPLGFTGQCETQCGATGCTGADPEIHATQGNLNAILYIINQTIGEFLGFSANDIQAAIWTILFSIDQVGYQPTLPNIDCPGFIYCPTNANFIVQSTFNALRSGMFGPTNPNLINPNTIILGTNNQVGVLLLPPPGSCENQCQQLVMFQYPLNCCQNCPDNGCCGGGGGTTLVTNIIIGQTGPTGPQGSVVAAGTIFGTTGTTTALTLNTWTPMTLTTALGNATNFVQLTNNQLRYTGPSLAYVLVIATTTFSSSVDSFIYLGIGVNGSINLTTQAGPIITTAGVNYQLTTTAVFAASPSDYYSIFMFSTATTTISNFFSSISAVSA